MPIVVSHGRTGAFSSSRLIISVRALTWLRTHWQAADGHVPRAASGVRLVAALAKRDSEGTAGIRRGGPLALVGLASARAWWA